MKTRVVQLITFEIESSDLDDPIPEDEADEICSIAASNLLGDVAGLVIHGTQGKRTSGIMMDGATVTVAKISADELTYILLDRRRLHSENVRLHAQREVLRAFIKESCAGPKSAEALSIADAVNPKPTEDPEETQG